MKRMRLRVGSTDAAADSFVFGAVFLPARGAVVLFALFLTVTFLVAGLGVESLISTAGLVAAGAGVCGAALSFCETLAATGGADGFGEGDCIGAETLLRGLLLPDACLGMRKTRACLINSRGRAGRVFALRQGDETGFAQFYGNGNALGWRLGRK